MPRIIFCIAILTLLVILLAKLGHRIYWRIRNRMNHCKGRVVKRMCKSQHKVLYSQWTRLSNARSPNWPTITTSRLS